MGTTIYAENLSFALILFAILRAISIGIRLLAPARRINENSAIKEEKLCHEQVLSKISEW